MTFYANQGYRGWRVCSSPTSRFGAARVDSPKSYAAAGIRYGFTQHRSGMLARFDGGSARTGFKSIG